MVYVSFAILAAGPAGIALAFWLIIIGRATAPYWRPFLFNEPLGQRKHGAAPANALLLPPLPPPTDGDLRRLHFGAAIFAVIAAVAMTLFVLSSEAFLFPGCTDVRMSCFGDWVVYQLGPLALLASIPFALVYLGRLWRIGVDGAEHRALAVWAVPRLAFVATTAFTTDAAADASRSWTLAAVLTAVALVVAALTARRLRLPSRSVRRLWRLASVAAIAVLATAMFAVPLLLMIDGFLSAIAIGYGIYRMRTRAQAFERRRPDRAAADVASASPRRANSSGSTRYRAAILGVIAVAALAAIALPNASVPAAAHPWALFGAAGAAAVAVFAFGGRFGTHHEAARLHNGPNYADAAITFAVVATAGAATQLSAYGGFDDVGGDASVVGLTLPAILGAAMLLATLLFARWHTMRPFLLATTWPLLFAYCAIGTTPGEWHVNPSAAAAAAALSIGTLWAMWYAFAPPPIARASGVWAKVEGASLQPAPAPG